jgi:hypothetical protein
MTSRPAGRVTTSAVAHFDALVRPQALILG